MLIWRSCDGRVPRAPRMYHSGETSDAQFFLHELARRQPTSPLLSVGVSLGANVLLKWLGEHRPPPTLRAAAAVSTPFDLGAGALHLERGFSKVYVRHFVRSLRRKALAALAVHPALPVDRDRLMRAQSFWEFDDAVTAPVHGVRGADDYYAGSRSLGCLAHITTPALLFSAIDDPFLPAEVLDEVRREAETNRALQPEFTPAGGHVGWIAGSPFAPRSYMEAHVTSWLARFA